MKAKQKRLNIARIVVGLLVMIAACGVTYWFLHENTHANETVAVVDTQQIEFAFDEARAPGWWGSNFSPDSKQQAGYPEGLLADRVIFQGEQGKPGACFLTFSYWDEPVDPAAALEEKKVRTVSGDKNLTLEPLGVNEATINTPEGLKEYELHRFNLKVPQGRQLKTGIAFGFVPLRDGHISVVSTCDTAAELPGTLPVLSAVELI